jgi:hypothetical protein
LKHFVMCTCQTRWLRTEHAARMKAITKAYKLLSQNLKGRDILQGTSNNGGTVLKNWEEKSLMDWRGSGKGSVMGFLERSNQGWKLLCRTRYILKERLKPQGMITKYSKYYTTGNYYKASLCNVCCYLGL